MTITLGPDMEVRLREKGVREGREPDAVAKMPLADVSDGVRQGARQESEVDDEG